MRRLKSSKSKQEKMIALIRITWDMRCVLVEHVDLFVLNFPIFTAGRPSWSWAKTLAM